MLSSSEQPFPWRPSDERLLMENLLASRFNCLLIFVSIIAWAATSAAEPQVRTGLFALGAVVSTLLMLAIGRTQQKLDYLIDAMAEGDQTHPAIVTTRAVKGFSVRSVMGYSIPMVCSVALWAGFVLSILGAFPGDRG